MLFRAVENIILKFKQIVTTNNYNKAITNKQSKDNSFKYFSDMKKK